MEGFFMFKRLMFGVIIACYASSATADVRFWKHVWKQTDFTKTAIDYKSVLQGGPGKDGIPALSDPTMMPVEQNTQLAANEPVMTVEMAGQPARAYPIRYLMWHEIVNDTVEGIPIAVTYCPLCNSGIVFDRRLNGKTYTFGVSGLLRNSDMIMFDRETESWWQQFTGDAIVGDLLGQKLIKIPGWMESWETFKTRNPDGLVQAEPESRRNYGQNPYVGYDTGRPFLYNGENPPFGINPLARVVAIENQAWPLQRIQAAGSIEEGGYTISWNAGTASALDRRNIAAGRDVGAIRVRDASGNDVVHDVAFAFAFHAFHPDGEWMLDK
jgi:hypothetical protein